MRQFYLHQRHGVFYVQFTDPYTKKLSTAKSTGKTTRDEALFVAHEWLLKGSIPQKKELPDRSLATVDLLTGLRTVPLSNADIDTMEKILQERGFILSFTRKNSPSSELFTDFLLRFWDWNGSPYVKEKVSHRLKIGKKHVAINRRRVQIYWADYFKGKCLGEVTHEDLKAFSDHLGLTYSDLSSQTLNYIVKAGTTAIKWAHANNLIPSNVASGLIAFSSLPGKKRGVLTPQEALAVFSLDWPDNPVLSSQIYWPWSRAYALGRC
jgi:hypothetical protein